MKFTMSCSYSPSLISNPRDEMSRFVTGVANLVKEECSTTMIHCDMNLSRLMVMHNALRSQLLLGFQEN